MNLLFVSLTYPNPWQTNQGTFNREMIRGMRERHRVKVLAPVSWIVRWTQGSYPPVETDTEHPIFYYPPIVLRSTYGGWLSWSLSKAVNQLKDFRPDAVLGYWAHPDSHAAVEIAKRWNVPCVVMVGGSDIKLLAQTRARRAPIVRVLQSCDRIVAFSKDLQNSVVDLGIPCEKIDVIRRGIDRKVFCKGDRSQAREKLRVSPSSILLVWAGRLVDVKNPMMLLRSLEVWKTNWGARLQVVMIGEGPLREELETFLAQHALSDVCQLVGSLPHATMADWYRAADLVLLTSLSEGIPNVLLEAISCGASFVATDVGGVREIASQDLDRLVPSNDVDAFQHAVIHRMAHSSLAGRDLVPDDLAKFSKRIEETILIARGTR